MLSALVDLGPMGAQAHGNEQANSKIENSVVITGSNNWYWSPWSEKAKPRKNLEYHIMVGLPCLTNVF